MRCAEEAAARYPRCTMAVVNGDAAAEAAEVKHELEQRVHNVDAWYEGQISPVLRGAYRPRPHRHRRLRSVNPSVATPAGGRGSRRAFARRAVEGERSLVRAGDAVDQNEPRP